MNVYLRCIEIVDHILVDIECTGRYGRQQTAARHNAGEGGLVDSRSLKSGIDVLHAVIKLIHDPRKRLNFIQRVANRLSHDLFIVVKNRDFR